VAGAVLFACLPQLLVPPLERNQFAVEIYFPEGTALAKNAETVRDFSGILRSDKRVTDVISFVGTSSPRFHTLYAPQMPAKNYSQLIVITDTFDNAEKVMREYDARYRDYFPNAHLRFKQLSFLSAEAPLEVRISGDSIEEIKTFADRVRKIMAEEEDIIWLRDDYRNYLLGVDLDMDKEAANRLGLTRGMLGASAALNRNGLPVGVVWDGDYAKNVVLKYEEAKTSSPQKLGDQYVGAPMSPKPVLLRQVSELKPSFSEGQVVRRNGRLTLTLRGDVAFGKLAAPVFSRISKRIKALEKPGSVNVSYGGEYDMSLEIYEPFIKALITGIILIFLILLFQFRTARIAFLVMATMPLSLVGSMFGLFLLGFPFGMTCFIGLIGLFGMVVRNGVILISYAHELEHGGMSVKEAAFAAGKRRLRPIFLTASAAAVGVIPLITSGSLLWGPLGTVICFGLIGSTILTLYVLPVAYWRLGETKAVRGEA
ncbi:MAG: efflux RND transporter permease subunit, partial [Elusimicrobia bacterium]|nr:efflux RND transporter permease subunit [Elusimicrobiota bacterium]